MIKHFPESRKECRKEEARPEAEGCNSAELTDVMKAAHKGDFSAVT